MSTQTWNEMKQKLLDYSGDVDVIVDVISYLLKTDCSIPDDDVPLLIKEFSKEYARPFVYELFSKSSLTVERLLQNKDFYDFLLSDSRFIPFYLDTKYGKQKREKILDDFFSRNPDEFLSNLTTEEILKYKVIPSSSYEIKMFLLKYKSNNEIMLNLCQKLPKNKKYPRILSWYSQAFAAAFGLFHKEFLPKAYQVLKDTRFCCFFLANAHITQEMKLKALKCLSNYNYTFRFAHKITQDELLQLTPNQLYNFLSHLFSTLYYSTTRSELNVVELPPKEKLHTFLLPLITRDKIRVDFFFEKYDIYNNIMSNGESYRATLDRIKNNLEMLDLDRIAGNKEHAKRMLQILCHFAKHSILNETEEKAREIVTFLKQISTREEFKKLSHCDE